MASFSFAAAKVAVVTGGGSGIGRALCFGLAKRGVKSIVVVDVDARGAEETAEQLRHFGGCSSRAARCDVSTEADVNRLIDDVEQNEGLIDVFMANAGIGGDFGLVDGASMELWHRMMGVNVYQSVYAARRLLPSLAERGGCFTVTSSAAGLMMQMGSIAYTTTKHASRALAEWLAVTYGDAGLRVACLCPQAVETKMTAGGTGVAGLDGLIGADVACESLFKAVESGQFLALPHPEVATYVKRKAEDIDRWMKGMRKVQAKVLEPMLQAQAKL